MTANKHASIWQQTPAPGAREPLQGDITADAVVIGGGMAGILTAFFLREKGCQAIVLEAGRIGSGATKGTTAKITSQHGLLYSRLLREQGALRARMYYDAMDRAIRDFRQIIETQKISCHLEEKAAYLYTRRPPRELEREQRALEKLNIPAVYTQRANVPFPIQGAIRFDGQAQLHPLEFLYAISKELPVYENTLAQGVEGNRVVTDKGTVTAGRIIIATHFPFIDIPGFYFARLHEERSYVLALQGAALPDGMFIDEQKGGLSLRTFGEHLLLGGGNHRSGKWKDGYGTLLEAARVLYPGAKEVCRWSAQDCIPLDGMPYIGDYSSTLRGVYVATGFQKWGVTGSMAAARLLCDLVTGEKNPYADLFTPQRFRPFACALELAENGAETIRSQVVRAVPARQKARDLQKGQGGVVDWNGKKKGGYRDMDGRLHLVSLRCPHMGCELAFNPDELTWDCPCHGSRFDIDGNLLDNPATAGAHVERSGL